MKIKKIVLWLIALWLIFAAFSAYRDASSLTDFLFKIAEEILKPLTYLLRILLEQLNRINIRF